MSDRREPIGLSREAAAAYIGVSPVTFDRLVDDGLMPGPRALRGRLVWIAPELADALVKLPVARGSKPEDAFVVWENPAA